MKITFTEKREEDIRTPSTVEKFMADNQFRWLVYCNDEGGYTATWKLINDSGYIRNPEDPIVLPLDKTGDTPRQAVDNFLLSILGKKLEVYAKTHTKVIVVPSKWDVPEVLDELDTVLKTFGGMLDALRKNIPVGVEGRSKTIIGATINQIEQLVLGRPVPYMEIAPGPSPNPFDGEDYDRSDFGN